MEALALLVYNYCAFGSLDSETYWYAAVSFAFQATEIKIRHQYVHTADFLETEANRQRVK
jgi:hypothetical protein